MANRRNDEWASSREVYTPKQVENVLLECGVDVRDETENDFLSFCPYHANSDSPAFSTSKRYGYSVCFNPSCAVGTDPKEGRLTLEKLVREVKRVSHFEAKRLILLKKDEGVSFRDRFDSVADLNEELQEFPAVAIDNMHKRLWETPAAVEYLYGRGFEDETLTFFKAGFTPETRWPAEVVKPDMVVIPAYDNKSRPVGLIGRSIVGKEFKNFGGGAHGKGFHKSKIIWNLNNARKHETIILTESTFDAMRVHQAGYPNVGALLGGSLSRVQEELLKRHFTRIVIMTDNETGNDIQYPPNCRKCTAQGHKYCQGHQPGRDLGMKIAEALPQIRVSWAAYDDKVVYANNVKDAAGMTDDEIRQCLRGAISHFEYLDWVA